MPPMDADACVDGGGGGEAVADSFCCFCIDIEGQSCCSCLLFSLLFGCIIQ